ncbi:protein of unknown function [Streptantibioticus cattleyicolor NRRL 8057 = DSM 46488]|nr:protein of unknown function [Streptantibioticus cattleyicolor NRRL 8057 = DSM 46488]
MTGNVLLVCDQVRPGDGVPQLTTRRQQGRGGGVHPSRGSICSRAQESASHSRSTASSSPGPGRSPYARPSSTTRARRPGPNQGGVAALASVSGALSISCPRLVNKLTRPSPTTTVPALVNERSRLLICTPETLNSVSATVHPLRAGRAAVPVPTASGIRLLGSVPGAAGPHQTPRAALTCGCL